MSEKVCLDLKAEWTRSSNLSFCAAEDVIQELHTPVSSAGTFVNITVSTWKGHKLLIGFVMQHAVAVLLHSPLTSPRRAITHEAPKLLRFTACACTCRMWTLRFPGHFHVES